MKYLEFEHLLLELIKEQETKLGYVYGSTRLYFLKSYLCGLLGVEVTRLQVTLENLQALFQAKYGELGVRDQKERICLEVSPEVCEYVHCHILVNPFLVDLVALCQKHKVTEEEVRSMFAKYSQEYTWDVISSDDIDCLVSFKDKTITPYYYGIKWTGDHISYHRYLEHDLPELLA